MCVCVCVCGWVGVWLGGWVRVYVGGGSLYIFFFTVWLNLISNIYVTRKVVCSHTLTDDKVCFCPTLLEKQGVCLVLDISLHGYQSVFARI